VSAQHIQHRQRRLVLAGLALLAAGITVLASQAGNAPGQPLAHPLSASLSASPSSVGPAQTVDMTLTIGASSSDPGIKIREVDIDYSGDSAFHAGSTSGFTSANPDDNGSAWSWTGLDVHLINPSGPPTASMSFSFSAPSTPGSYSYSATVIADGAGDGSAQTSITVVGASLPTVSIGDVSVTEGNSGTTTASFPVTLSSPAGGTVSVAYATADGSATAGSDYTATSGTATFASGESSETANVIVNGDTVHEGDENFFVDISSPSGATIADGHGVGTIVDDDAIPAVSIGDVSVIEGNSGTKTASFPVKMSNATTSTVTVGYATQNGSAAAGSDYVATSGTLTLAPGETSSTIGVGVTGDILQEQSETFKVVLSSPTNATIADGQAVGTILDDDGGGPDVAIQKQAKETQVQVGDVVTFTIVVTNVGTKTAEGANVSDLLPSGLELDHSSSSQGSCSGTGCSLGELEPGESATVTIVVRATSAGTKTTTASISTTTSDPNTGNNSASAVVSVAAETAPPPVQLPPPSPGEVNLGPAGGTSAGQCVQTVDSPACIPLTEGVQVAISQIALIDPKGGAVWVQGIEGKMQFSGTPFDVTELDAPSSGPATVRPVLVLQLQGGQFGRICRASPKSKLAAGARSTAVSIKKKKPVRRLFGNGKGRFRTKGRYSAGTVRGTYWVTVDRCDGTLTHVYRGVVSVHDLVLHRYVRVAAGQSYLASPAKKKKKK